MYKRKKRRANKGKKKLSVAATNITATPTSSPARTTELSADELTLNGEAAVTTNDKMSVTTMDATDQDDQQQTQQLQPQRPSLDLTTSNYNNNNNNKAVGARKRKPMQISKIVDKLPVNDHPINFGAEKNLVHNNNNNNSPPYKKPCLELSKNGMIKNILSELKTAKMGGGNNNKGDTPMTRRLYERDEDDDDLEEEEDDRSEDETSETLRIKVVDDEDDGDDDEEEGVDYSGNEDAKFVHNNKRNNLYVSPSSSSFKCRYGGAGSNSMKDHHRHHRQDFGGSSYVRADVRDIQSRLLNKISTTTTTTKQNSIKNNKSSHNNDDNNNKPKSPSLGESRDLSPNGRSDRNKGYNVIDEDDSANDEGTDLRSITGNSTGDDELPFRCGVCAYGTCDKSTLLRHMRRTHSGERPFQCRLCFFAFTTKANCERHLRNRHDRQIDREQLRDLVVCLPTSSNASESETEMNSNGGTQQSYPMALVGPNKRRNTGGGGGGGMLVTEENELPLDLSMDAVDLSTHSKHGRDGGNPIFRRKASLPRPRPMYAANEMSNSLVTSPFISKREPMVHPQLQLNSFTSHSIAPQAPVISTPNHPPFSLFPFGGPPGFNPFVIPPTNVEKLMGLGSNSPPKIPNYIAASPKGSYESLVTREPISVEKESKIKIEPVTESKRSGSNSKSASSSSVSPATSSRKRADTNNTNGEYQKPKQRRYRTERPYSCPFCPARFTLRSNMERHGKHQHPTVWVRSPSNRVINRQKNQQLSPLVGSPTLVQPKNKYNSNNSIGADSSKEKNNKDSAVNVNVRAVIAQQLKRKLSNSSLRNNNNGSETETDPENTPVHEGKNSGGDTPDLATVSQLLDRVKNSNFAQYFNEAENHNFNNDNNNSDDDELEGDESGEEDGLSDERSADEGDSKASGGVEKKKSAYSSSPHKISCPHCPRRFPWTSSLRRHLLTHTGQKPFQCSKCPLLFTTKSNCDRHLARKHSGSQSKGTSDSNNSSEDDEEGEEEENEQESVDGGENNNSNIVVVQNTTENNNTINTNNNNNNNNHKTPSAANLPNNSSLKNPTPNGNGTPVNSTSSSSSSPEDAAFRCHLCEAAASEREALLAHMEEHHKETFNLLVSKGALSSSPQSDQNSENEQAVGSLDQRDVTHRKVMCVFCVRRFWSVEDLRRHIRSHSGERPFSCTHCNRRFTLKHSMLRHLKKHSTSVTPSRKLAKASKEQIVIASGNAASGKNGDLIGRLLGIKDDHIEQLLNQPDAKNAEKLLGLGAERQHTQSRATSKVN